MEKRDIIKRFMEQGYLLTPEAIEKLRDKNIDDLMRDLKKIRKTTIDVSDVEILLKGISSAKKTLEKEKQKIKDNTSLNQQKEKNQPPDKEAPKETKILVGVRKIEKKKKLSPKDFVDYYNNKYNGLKNILSKKLRAVSINNAKTSTSTLSVIGMVKETTPRGFVIEDPTGSMDVTSKRSVSVDDVIGVTGFVRENRMFENEIVYPDIPLIHPIGRIDAVVALSSKKTDKIKETDMILNDADYPNPGWITVSRDNRKLIMLIYNPSKNITAQEATEYLKKRHLSPDKKKINNPEDYFMIEPIPDIVWIVSDKRWIITYKGVTILSCGPNHAAKINLKTRDVVFEKI